MEADELKQQVRPQIEAVLSRVVIKLEGEYSDPEIDIDAILSRAETLDPKDPIKADIYRLVKELKQREK